MQYLLLLFGVTFIWSCSNPVKDGKDHLFEKYEEIFLEVDQKLKMDNGQFWGYPLYGPIVFVDPETRVYMANKGFAHNDNIKPSRIYSDTLPLDLNIANTAIDWQGERWTMVMLPLPTDKISRHQLIIHELFHRMQPEIGFENLIETDNRHLDSYEGRVLLKLELEALIQALGADKSEETKMHISNALSFRHFRQKDGDKKLSENALELNEGLAEYTGLMLSGRANTEVGLYFRNSIDSFYNNPTFVRSFAYHTIPMYGYLLSKINPEWQKDISKSTMLGDYFSQAFSVSLGVDSTFESLARSANYNYKHIIETERKRENERIETIRSAIQKYIEAPTLKLNFQNMNISFDPRNIIPVESIGTVYPSLRVTDNWGILTSENGAMISMDWSSVSVTAPTVISDSLVTGDGWNLILKESWKVVEVEGKYILTQE